jgi:hypothetical protein
MNADINDKHLGMVQGVINRLAGNSFSLKGWSMTLVSALLGLALSGKGGNPLGAVIALLPALAFWSLDGYFLAQERLYRRLYAKLIAPNETVPAFSMRTEPFTAAVWAKATFSLTLILFHGAVLALIIAVLAYLSVIPTTHGT